MVSVDIRRIIDLITEKSEVLRVGAESTLYLSNINNIKIILKIRRMKPYMDPELASHLVYSRTVKEAKIMATARINSVPTPRLYLVLPSLGLIAMEYLEGPTMKSALDVGELDPIKAGYEAGTIIGKLHSIGIAHGDPTTSNFIIKNNYLYIIDFGLAEFTNKLEDRAVDIHLFRRIAYSSHANIAETLVRSFESGYKSQLGKEAERVIDRAREIELMGRYVEERRTVWQK